MPTTMLHYGLIHFHPRMHIINLSILCTHMQYCKPRAESDYDSAVCFGDIRRERAALMPDSCMLVVYNLAHLYVSLDKGICQINVNANACVTKRCHKVIVIFICLMVILTWGFTVFLAIFPDILAEFSFVQSALSFHL